MGEYTVHIVLRGSGEEILPAEEQKFFVWDTSSVEGETDHLIVDTQSPLEVGRMSSTLIVSILQVAAALGLDFPTEQYEKDLAFFQIKYRTTYKGEEIIASAVLAVPDEAEQPAKVYPLQLTMADTITKNENAALAVFLADDAQLAKDPAVALFGGSARKMAVFAALTLASMGYVSILPDGIGFGTSRIGSFHPYLHEESLARSGVDALLAAQEFTNIYLEKFGGAVDVRSSTHAFLTGYSEGAYAALAVQKKVESEGIAGIDVAESYVGGGPYLLEEVGKDITDREVYTFSAPAFIPYLILAYEGIYEADEFSLPGIFNQPYARTARDLFGASRNLSVDEINRELTEDLTTLTHGRFSQKFS